MGVAGEEVVDGDAEGAEFGCECAGPVGDGGADGVGYTEAFDGHDDGGGDDIDDPAVAGIAHAGCDGLHEGLVGQHVLIHGSGVFFGCCFEC